MKHLKIRGTLSQDCKTVLVSVVSQTHFGAEFAEGVAGTGQFRSSNLVELCSDDGDPAYFPGTSSDKCKFALYVNGSHTKEDVSAAIPISAWDDLKIAVSEYNEWGKDK